VDATTLPSPGCELQGQRLTAKGQGPTLAREIPHRQASGFRRTAVGTTVRTGGRTAVTRRPRTGCPTRTAADRAYEILKQRIQNNVMPPDSQYLEGELRRA